MSNSEGVGATRFRELLEKLQVGSRVAAHDLVYDFIGQMVHDQQYSEAQAFVDAVTVTSGIPTGILLSVLTATLPHRDVIRRTALYEAVREVETRAGMDPAVIERLLQGLE